MNTKEISKPIFRLKRIKTLSQLLKFLFVLYPACHLIANGYHYYIQRTVEGYWRIYDGTYATFAEIPFVEKLLAGLAVGGFLLLLTTGYQLLSLYEKGIVFSARNVRLLGRIGLFALALGLLNLGSPLLVRLLEHFELNKNELLLSLISALTSAWIIGGIFAVVLSRIMDEGRKIQEEQELTV